MPPPFAIDGFTDDRFAPVRETFVENFSARSEVGAAVCVYLGGRPVVDLWGGHADAARTRPWEAGTILCMMSVSKAMVALCAHILIDRGLLDLDAPVARYWPEFAQAGKADITVDCLISHLAALVYPDAVPQGALPGWNAVIEGLARQAPAWAPGTRGAYHSSTFGHLVGELVRRVSGRPVDAFFAEEIAGPLHADFRFGLTAADDARVAEFIVNPDSVSLRHIAAETGSPLSRAWRPLPRAEDVFNSRMWRESVLPSANGHGNARAVARIMAAVIGEVDGVRLLSPAAVETLREERWHEECGLTGRRFRFGRGFALHNPAFHPMGVNPRAFGHAGVGGSFAFADPEARLSFAYSMNHAASGSAMDDRPRALIDTLYDCLREGIA
ncbi:serine hydrolase domain-containing protein [Sphingomonas canadensis]|uniref:Serine hydrolase domain-containing protein n=1 Tax=Sphingomonas canadensis TaxID=1219257 RepID=A0ABW3H312_9SPHN|nr:beta-lactamase family protein [Sphingomonas canadensis]